MSLKRQIKDVVFTATALALAGNARQCTLCNWRFRKFLPHGVGPVVRQDAKCPRCRSLERHRALWLYLNARTSLLTSPTHLLHCAPEPMLRNLLQKQRTIRYVTVDYCDPSCAARVDLVRAPFADQCFEAIICNHVLEHIPEDRAAMRELWRILKPGGWAIIQCPIDPSRSSTYEDPRITSSEDRQREYGHYDHKRLYGTDYADRLRESGFHVTVDPFVRNLPQADRTRFGLDEQEDIFLCAKTS